MNWLPGPDWPLWANVVAFAAAALAIALAGWRLAGLADRLADRTGLGEAVTGRELFLTSQTILINVLLLLGLIHRQKRGPANIGFESAAILVIYIAGFLLVSLVM